MEIQPTGTISEYTATITEKTLREGKKGRHKVETLKLTLKAEGIILEYNLFEYARKYLCAIPVAQGTKSMVCNYTTTTNSILTLLSNDYSRSTCVYSSNNGQERMTVCQVYICLFYSLTFSVINVLGDTC